MPGLKTMQSKRQRLLGLASLLVGVAAVFAPVSAAAHFILVAPAAWMSQDSLGLPEKLGPCGDEGGGTPTGAVTAFHPGQTIVVTINEVIPHPGHYRVALAVNNRDELPAEPVVTPTADDPCASAAIENPASFPVLADNLLPHTQAFPGPQTFCDHPSDRRHLHQVHAASPGVHVGSFGPVLLSPLRGHRDPGPA